jgi:TPR repeat protein
MVSQGRCDQGLAEAQRVLGFMLETGRGVTKDEREAVAWYRKAAASGNAAGQAYLGDMLEYGTGVTKNRAEALSWYRKAADQGNDFAIAALKRLGEQP